MTHAYFFGYGSLVNRNTHLYTPVRMARLPGWRRQWVATPHRGLCYLTAVKDEACAIDGLVAEVPGADWAALDTRETGYDRHDTKVPGSDHATAIYAVPEQSWQPHGPEHPILLSYLDVVIAGYLSEFGTDGPQHFFETTSGWDAPVLNDRDAPLYPRAQPLTTPVRERVDDWLASCKSTILVS